MTGNIKSTGISIARSGITFDGAGFTLEGIYGGPGISFEVYVGEVTVKNLKITNFDTGVSLNGNSGNVFVGNDVSDNTYNGFYYSGTCSNNTLNGNRISNNPRWGIIIVGRESPYGGPSTDNLVVGNTIENNGWEKSTIPSYGMDDDYGAGVWLWVATNNTFYGNKFVNNAQQAFVFDQSINIWSSGPASGGNYWSDYCGIDADGNKIGDSPYVIDVVNSDPYPLIAQPSGDSPSEDDENEQQSQIPFEYIIVLVVAVVIIVLLAFVFRKRKQSSLAKQFLSNL